MKLDKNNWFVQLMSNNKESLISLLKNYNAKTDCNYQNRIYYGVVNGIIYSYQYMENLNAPLISIEEAWDLYRQKTFPREMMVRDDETQEWIKRIVLFEADNKFHAARNSNNYKTSNIYEVCRWNCAKEIEEPTELTMQEIADKFNIPVEQLKIKK